MFNWIGCDRWQYLEVFYFIDLCLQIIYIQYVMYKLDLVLNNLQ